VLLGQAEKSTTSSETENKKVVRKNIVAKKPIKKGEIFSLENLATKRAGGGLSPMLWDKVVGQAAEKDYFKDQVISESCLSSNHLQE